MLLKDYLKKLSNDSLDRQDSESEWILYNAIRFSPAAPYSCCSFIVVGDDKVQKWYF